MLEHSECLCMVEYSHARRLGRAQDWVFGPTRVKAIGPVGLFMRGGGMLWMSGMCPQGRGNVHVWGIFIEQGVGTHCSLLPSLGCSQSKLGTRSRCGATAV